MQVGVDALNAGAVRLQQLVGPAGGGEPVARHGVVLSLGLDPLEENGSAGR